MPGRKLGTRLGVELELREAGEQTRQDDVELESPQRCSEAEVRAQTEGDVWVGRSLDVEALGVDEDLGITIC